MRKHRHLPFTAMFCLLLSVFCLVRAQQQAGKTRLLYLSSPLYKCAASLHSLVFNMHVDRTLWFTFCSSAPTRLRVLLDPDLSQCAWCLPEHVAGRWCAFEDALGGMEVRAVHPGWLRACFLLGRASFALLACVGGIFAVRRALPLTCREAVWLF